MSCPITSGDAKEYKRLNKLRIAGMKYAENRCKKLRIGEISWTPELTLIQFSIEV